MEVFVGPLDLFLLREPHVNFLKALGSQILVRVSNYECS